MNWCRRLYLRRFIYGLMPYIEQLPFLGTSSDVSVVEVRIDMCAVVFHYRGKGKRIIYKITTFGY